LDTSGIEFIVHRFDGYRVQLEVQYCKGLLSVVWYEATRDDDLLSHVRIEAGPYASREALIAAVDAVIRRA
jgi:hypothetical protein